MACPGNSIIRSASARRIEEEEEEEEEEETSACKDGRHFVMSKVGSYFVRFV